MSQPPKKKPLSDLELSYKRTFLSADGQRVLKDLMMRLRFHETVYHPKQPNEDLHYELGRQSVANEINSILNKEA